MRGFELQNIGQATMQVVKIVTTSHLTMNIPRRYLGMIFVVVS